MSDSNPSHQNDQIAERKRPELLETWVKNGLLVESSLQGVGYAGSGENPRPVPNWSLQDLKERFQAPLRKARVPDALYFGFYSDKLKSEAQEIIPVRNRDFWYLARAGDTVLLSDRKTHHYTAIHSVDRREGKVWIVDPWPDAIFLREGLNEAGVAAMFVGSGSNKLVVITREEFLRVVIGLITLDSPDLIEYYFTVNPAARRNARTVLALGCALLNFGNDSYVHRAEPYLRSALELAEQQEDTDLRFRAAHRLITALQLIFFELLPSGDRASLEAIQLEEQRLFGRYSGAEIASRASAEDFYRLGNAAGRVNQFGVAANFYSGAIGKDPKHEDAYKYRALVKSRLGDAMGVVEDTTKALELNEAEYSRVLASLDAIENQSAFRRAEAYDTLSHLLSKRVQTFQMRAEAYSALGQMDRATADTNEVVRLQSGGS